MRLDGAQRASTLRGVSSQLAKTTLATAASMLNSREDDGGSERVCDDCWARLGRGRAATPPPTQHTDDDLAYAITVADGALLSDGRRAPAVALELRAPDGRVLGEASAGPSGAFAANSCAVSLPATTRTSGAYVLLTARDRSKDDLIGRGRCFLENNESSVSLTRDGRNQGTVRVRSTRSSPRRPLSVAVVPPGTSKKTWPVSLEELYPPGTRVHAACFETVEGRAVPARELALDAFADVDNGVLLVTSHRFLHVSHALAVVSVPHASILGIEVAQRDDALVLMLTTRSYQSIAFASRTATNRDFSWCRGEWRWRLGEDAFWRRPVNVEEAVREDLDEDGASPGAELLSKLGLDDLDDRSTRRRKLQRFLDPKLATPPLVGADVDLGAEFARQGVATDTRWRATDANQTYELCETYPPLLIVPRALSDARLKEGARWRAKRRVPVLTWYDKATGAALIRASQPRSGLTGTSRPEDDAALLHVRAAAARSRGAVAARLDDPTAFDDEEGFLNVTSPKQARHETPPILRICDCRSIVAAKANAVLGKGHEAPAKLGGHQAATLEFLDLENFHVIRNSHRRLAEASSANVEDYYRALHESKWPCHLQQLLEASRVVADHLERGDPVFCHCSDGWDRTAQVCALSQLIVDPFYRTLKGFAVLVEKDFCSFGHPFRTRSLVEGETGPVFEMFLEAVASLRAGAPAAFEFTEALLELLKNAVHSRFYGNFLRDADCDRRLDDAVSVWRVVEGDPARFRSQVYDATAPRRLRVTTRPVASADAEVLLLRRFCSCCFKVN